MSILIRNNLEIIKHKIKEALTRNLPGIQSQLKMAPFLGNQPARELIPKFDTKPSAVLLLLVYNKSKLNVLLTLRSSTLLHHKNQISFPGGMSENNETPIQTAFREAKEEIGIDSNEIEVLGFLTDLYVQPSNTLVKPIVAWSNRLPKFKVNKNEVEDIFIIPIEYFLDKDNLFQDTWQLNNQNVAVPYWIIQDRIPLWGATAMILSEFLDIYHGIIANELEFKIKQGNSV